MTLLLLLLHSLSVILGVIIRKKDLNVMRHSVHCSFCYYVHYTCFQKKKYFYNFLLCSLRHGYVKKKQNFISALRPRRHDHEKNCLYQVSSSSSSSAFSICKNVFLLVLGVTYNVHTSLSCANINCYYGHYAAIMTKKYILSFQHYYIHYTVVMRKNYFLPYC